MVAEDDRARPELLDQILDSAERLAQKAGYSDLTLTRIAEGLGVHYTAVYHYVPSRDALDAELILRISQRRDRLLKTAVESDQPRLDALCQYVRVAIAELPPTHVTRVAALSQPHRARAQRALRAHQQSLAALIEQGIEDGSVRSCNARLAASFLLRILNRYAAREEDGLADARPSRARLADVIADVVANGLLLPDIEAPDTDGLKDLLRLPPPPPETRLESVLKALTQEINELGFSGASIPAVGKRLGVSKTVLYGYAKSKQELLFLCTQRSLARLDKVRTLAALLSGDCLGALWANVHLERLFEASEAGPFLAGSTYVHLSPEQQRCVGDWYTSVRRQVISLLDQGVAEGRIRPHDTRIMQPLMAAGAGASVARADRGPEDTDRVVDLMFRGLAASPR
jgi:AcrR family transcriptional regulator